MSITSQIATMHSSMNHDNVGMHVRTDQGQVVERVNLRVNSKGGKKLYNEKLIGNTLIPYDYPIGENKVIGWCNDYASDAIIYFVHNSNANHSIMRYYINTKSIEKIWYSEKKLGFEDSYVKAVVVDGMLYWVQEDTHPKSLDIQMAVNYMLHLYGGVFTGERYSVDDKPFDEIVFPLIKRPPQFAPTCEYGTDSSTDEYSFNNLRKKLFQFKYCFEYVNNQRSAWSPTSKVPLPTHEIDGNGIWKEDINVNNYIDVTVDSGSNQVRKILVAAKECNQENVGTFFLFKILDKDKDSEIQNDSSQTVRFMNTTRLQSVDTDVDNRYCDHVPLSASDITLLDNKYLALSRPEMDYDSITPDYTLTAFESDVIDLDVDYIPMETKCQWKKLYSAFPIGFYTYLKTIYLPEQFYPNSIYYITFTYDGQLYEHSVLSPVVKPADYPEGMRNEFLNNIRLEFWPKFADNVDGKFNGIQFEIDEDFPPLASDSCNLIENLEGYVTVGAGEYIPSVKTLKRGQYHPFAIIYNDNFGRYNVVFGDEEVYSPIVTSDVNSKNKAVGCRWEINHLPPDWATTFRWCYIRNKTYTYFQYILHAECIWGSDFGITEVPDGQLFININKSISETRSRYPNYMIPDYVWVNGDRIRIVGEAESYEILKEFIILGDEDGDSITGFLINADIRDDGNFITLAEVYRPNVSPQETVYLEIGEEYPIIDGFHTGPTQTQTNLLPATGTFDFGDVYFRYRFGPDGISQPIEDSWFNDYYISSGIDVGRAGAKIETKQTILNSVVRGENYLQNTEYNLLNVFLPVPLADRFDASDFWGKITGIQEVGDVLKIIQEHKETSIYVGKIQAKEADGSDIYLDSSNVFGTVNKYIEVRGSKYIRSVVKNNRYLYYFDDSTSEFIRSSANGQLPISSKYHMRNWFETKAKLFREYVGNKDIIVSCDNDYDETMISFVMGNDIESLVFSEEEFDNGWKYFATFKTTTKIPDNFAFQGDTSISWMDGQLYLHNVGAHNTFYGEQWGCYIKAAINVPGGVSKRFANIYINSDRNEWDIEFTTEDRVNYGPQKSYLKPSIIKEVNGRLHSTILRNILKRDGVTEDLNLLYNNHDMVGEVLFVKLSSSDSDDVSLGEIEVKFHINW